MTHKQIVLLFRDSDEKVIIVVTNTHYISIINIIILVIITRWRALPWHARVQLVHTPQVVSGGAERGSEGGLDQNSSRWTFIFSTNKMARFQVTLTWCSGCLSSERVLQKWPHMDTFLSLLFILRYTSLHFVYTCVNICVYTCILLNPFVYTFVYTSLHFCVYLCIHLCVHRCASVYQVKELSS